MIDFFLACAVGFATGILSAFGIGGGTLLLLCMTLFLGVDPGAAKSINLLYFLPTAALSLRQHAKSGYLRGSVIKNAVPPGIACAVGGVVLGALINGVILQKLFGVYLLFAGLSVFLPRRRSDKNAKADNP